MHYNGYKPYATSFLIKDLISHGCNHFVRHNLIQVGTIFINLCYGTNSLQKEKILQKNS